MVARSERSCRTRSAARAAIRDRGAARPVGSGAVRCVRALIGEAARSVGATRVDAGGPRREDRRDRAHGCRRHQAKRGRSKKAHAASAPGGGVLRALGEDVTELLDYVPARPASSGTCAPSCRAARARRSPRHRRPACRSAADALAPACWPTCWSANTATISRCTGGRDLRARGYRPQPLDDGRHGGPERSPAAAVRRRVETACHGGRAVHAGDTVVPVLEPGLGRTRTARLWVYVRDDRPIAGVDPAAVFYRYTPDRKGEHPRAHLSNYRGILQATRRPRAILATPPARPRCSLTCKPSRWEPPFRSRPGRRCKGGCGTTRQGTLACVLGCPTGGVRARRPVHLSMGPATMSACFGHPTIVRRYWSQPTSPKVHPMAHSAMPH